MNAADVLDLYSQLTRLGIETWLDGGWAVDVLLGEETQPHEDVDIVIQQKDVPKLRELLEAQGYKDVPRDDTSAWNFVLGDDKGHVSGYELDDNDRKDIAALCKRFSIAYPETYVNNS